MKIVFYERITEQMTEVAYLSVTIDSYDASKSEATQRASGIQEIEDT